MPTPSVSLPVRGWIVVSLIVLLSSCGDSEPGSAVDTGGAPGVARGTPTEALTSEPLAERLRTQGPRFRRVDPGDSGIDFVGELRPENNVPYLYSGAGVAVGDYDGDGLPDIYLVSQDGPNRLYRQVAPLQFEDVTAAAGTVDGGEAWGSAAAFADVDGDGDLDLYVCNTESPNLLYVNQGDGTFREDGAAWGLDVVAASTGAAFADYDNDGDLDLYVVTNRVFGPTVPEQLIAEVSLPAAVQKSLDDMNPPYPRFVERNGEVVVPPGYEQFYSAVEGRVFVAAQRDYLLRNDGGTFVDASTGAGIFGQRPGGVGNGNYGSGLSATWWDCDNDGWLDLYVANDLESPDQLWRNQGDGTFENVTRTALPHTAYFGMGSDFGDIDNDGRFDFCVADMSSTTHYMGKMLMGSMGARRWWLMNSDPQQYMRNALYINATDVSGRGGRSAPRFLEAGHMAKLSSSDWTWTVRFADLDDDGRLDFFATNGIPVFSDNPDTGAEFTRLWRAGEQDKALDLARKMPPVPERNIARRNKGDLEFEDVGAEWGLDELGVSHGAVLADLDRDGDLDVILNNHAAPASLYENRTHDTERMLVSLRGLRSNRHGVGARITVATGGVTQTRLVVLARGYMSSGEAVEHFGLGQNDTVDRMEVRWPSGEVQVFRELAAGRHYTVHEGAPAPAEDPVAVSAPAPPWFEPAMPFATPHEERDFDDYELQSLLPHRLSRMGPGMAWGDANGDGRDDLYLGGAAGQEGSLWLADGEGGFGRRSGPWAADAEREDMGALLFDADGDGDRDLYVVSGGIESGEHGLLLEDRLYVNNGSGAFQKAKGALPELQRSGSCVCAADFDNDGDLDLFVGSRVEPGQFPKSPSSTLLRNNGQGVFADATVEAAPGLQDAGMVCAAQWSDLDGDGALDLVVAAQWQPVRVFMNRKGSLRDMTSSLGLLAMRGQWNAVATADFDGDGDMDILATNLGLNTKYKADAEHPLRLYADDFDGNDVFDIIEAKSSGDRELPVRGLSCSSTAMPFLNERFPTYDAFARSDLAGIYGGDALKNSLTVSVNELRHMVLENTGERFVPHPLPRRAQIAPGYGVAIADLDGDGHLDIVMGHNSFSPEPETGRHDGGLGVVLAGRGGCEFVALSATASGLRIPDDAQALALVDLAGDGGLDVVCATNNGPLKVFKGAENSRRVAVRLSAPSGHVAVGARVECVQGESRQVAEVTAGAGYLSQGPDVVWVMLPAESDEPVQLRVRWPDGYLMTKLLDAADRESREIELVKVVR